MILLNKRITKALIRLHGCAGWSAPFLFANTKDRFSHVEAHLNLCVLLTPESILWQNSPDLDEMLHDAAFHQDLHCLLRKKMETITCYHLI